MNKTNNLDYIDVHFEIENKIFKDKDGYYIGMFKGVEILNNKKTTPRNSKELQDDVSYKNFKFIFELEGTENNIIIFKTTGTILSKEFVRVLGKGRGKLEKGEYNVFTTMCLKLGVFNEGDLNKFDDNRLLTMFKDFVKSNTEFEVRFKNLQEDGNINIDVKTIIKI
jgi:hypothetical protein